MLLFFAINFQAVDNDCPKGPHRDNWQYHHHNDVHSNLWTSLIFVEIMGRLIRNLGLAELVPPVELALPNQPNLLNSDTVKAAGGGGGVGVGKFAAGAGAGPNGLPGAIEIAGGFDGIGLT